MRNRSGFTLVELLVVVVIIGILAAIALPNYIGVQSKARAAAVKGNQRTIQIASEAYATDSGGAYSTSAGKIVNYLPGGSGTPGGSAGNLPSNPVTGASGVLGAAGLTTSALIQKQRTASAAAIAGVTIGNTGYDQADNGNSYAVTGADPAGNYTVGIGGNCLIMSNQ